MKYIYVCIFCWFNFTVAISWMENIRISLVHRRLLVKIITWSYISIQQDKSYDPHWPKVNKVQMPNHWRVKFSVLQQPSASRLEVSSSAAEQSDEVAARNGCQDERKISSAKVPLYLQQWMRLSLLQDGIHHAHVFVSLFSLSSVSSSFPVTASGRPMASWAPHWMIQWGQVRALCATYSRRKRRRRARARWPAPVLPWQLALDHRVQAWSTLPLFSCVTRTFEKRATSTLSMLSERTGEQVEFVSCQCQWSMA